MSSLLNKTIDELHIKIFYYYLWIFMFLFRWLMYLSKYKYELLHNIDYFELFDGNWTCFYISILIRLKRFISKVRNNYRQFFWTMGHDESRYRKDEEISSNIYENEGEGIRFMRILITLLFCYLIYILLI